MLYVSIGAADPWRIVASSIYGASLIILFSSSMLYHGLHTSSWRHILKLIDHCVIYVLIAGTYTPFLLVQMRTALGWSLFGAIWGLAIAGIVAKLWLKHRFPWWSLASYLLMGWLIVIAAPQLADRISGQGVAWLVAGGVFYTVGAVFYASQRIAFGHAIWHFFVLAGAASHFFAVIWHVLPVGQGLS
jgi:hemolysin III